jgi:small-conductance mechanosensitive channel
VWIWQFFQLATGIINYFTDKALERDSGPENETAYKFLNRMVKVMAFFVAVLLILSNLGYDVTSLVAGLGIGGIAIALAVQNVLSDVITSFSIIADKPFKPGDFITFDNFSGWVIRIGIKSTRMRSVEGEELIVANSKLVGSVLRNFTSSECRRSTQTITVNYGIDDKLLQDIPAFISDVLQVQESVDKNDFEVHLVRFDAAGYVFEITFNVLHPDQRKFLEIQQAVLFAINDKLHSEHIQFA